MPKLRCRVGSDAPDTPNVAAPAVMAFWALFVFSAELPAVRAHSPWAEDPYDVVDSFAALLVPLVAVLTFVRCQRWRGPATMPASAVRQNCGAWLSCRPARPSSQT